ncbi:hypothetical protein [Iamia sp.]|uniref:hypothetical protein n=1 Tax=Iamia sp. TaxID=2722710 RepID=UPI002BAC3B0B|nr:hypothetical protein [Iamia sp.]HXH56228.1 hypothetical protein [Iamia sp.]
MKERRARDHKPLGVIASELLLRALAADAVPERDHAWASQPMGAKVDLDDKDALWAVLDDR